jgi:hypothetical protein
LQSFLGFLADVFFNILIYFYHPKSKLEKNIEELKTEDWFKQLYEDIRYEYIIWSNKKVKMFLLKKENIQLLKTDEQVRIEFIDLIKSEHARFMKRKTY